MHLSSMLVVATAAAVSATPSLKVPACPALATVQYDNSVPDLAEFPLTQVDLCYDDTLIHFTFTAYNETNFYFNETQGTNDPIWMYEVMEAFIHRGTNDPQHYLEIEVNPNNVTFQAFIYNPSKVRAADAPMDTFYVANPLADGMLAETTLNREAETWVSKMAVPLGLFNVDKGQGKGTKWRMNFFRTVTSPEMFPDQGLGAWSVPDEANFHMTPFFGHICFV
ncbi:hypothetical protein DL769_004141 [Monosporascus sp. CRB-8-3]|nr:hypothetical protein DL769_004141 [Monosporascus sp. CRB-8-3]